MNKINCSFISIFFLLILGINIQACQPESLEPIVITRTPSTAPDSNTFFNGIEQHIQETEKAFPESSFYLDYGPIFIRLFGRIADSTEKQQLWIESLRRHSIRLAATHRIKGLKLFYKTLHDLNFAAALIEPYLAMGKLFKLDLKELGSIYASN